MTRRHLSMFFHPNRLPGIDEGQTSGPAGLLGKKIGAAFVLLVLLVGSVPVQAQDLSGELERLRRDLIDLQRFVYAGKPPASVPETSGVGASAGGGVTPEVAGQMQVKLQSLERALRELNGRFEEVDFRIRTLSDALERQAADQEIRFQRLEQATGLSAGGQLTGTGAGGLAPALSSAQQVGGAVQSLETTDGGAGSTGGLETGTTIVSSSGTQVQSDGSTLQQGQQALGTLRLDSQGNVVGAELAPQATPNQPAVQPEPAAPAAAPQAAPVSSSVGTEAVASTGPVTLPEGTAKEQYDFALTLLLRKRDYGGAESALRQFIDANGGDPLAGSAMYWLGETYYVRENYRDAAAVFVDSFSNYPNSSKASHSLLKLGMSLGALGKTDAACTAFATLKEKYPQAEARVLRAADAEGTRFGCS